MRPHAGITGEKDAVLVDPLFTQAQAEALREWVIGSAKNLTTVYITHGHPDHWLRLGHTDTDDTTCMHVPAIGLVVAGDAAYNNVHFYLAASGSEGRRSWLRALDTIGQLQPRAVVAGHKDPSAGDGPENIAETRGYIDDFEAGVAAIFTAVELYRYMRERFPRRSNPGALWGSARAAKE